MLIRCGGCEEAIFESNVSACPGCGRCPNCGSKRVPKRQLADSKACDTCGAPVHTCGRCHGCGKLRLFEVDACECGHPNDPKTIASVERYFGFR